ncbi:P-loop containing nucleoside triphosphate hydrolase protein [Apiospora kogelbergensis]|uniref:P-loop containing nucleoside triphosphate hydrolase protein n=1 Tax=Apiospora kogelbergensis TaxID=1337665 RepID=UPI0031305D80
MAKYDIVHRWYQKPDWSSWSVTIRGEPLKILDEVMGDHPDIDTTWGVLDLDSPYQPIRDRREDLENYRATVKDPKRCEIATLLTTFFNTAISASPMSEFDSLVPYDELKDAFKPGDIVVMVSAGVTSAHYLREFYRAPNKVEWIAVIECIDWNGSFFGFRSSRVEVPFYKGQEPITSLPICPIKCCKDRGSLEDRLVARGRKFEALRWTYDSRSQRGTGSNRWWQARVFYVEDLTDIEWRSNVADLMVIPNAYKELITSAIRSENIPDVDIDEVPSKDHSLLLFAFGPPGFGKTMYIEAFAEERRVPLYTLTAGELGSDPGTVQKALDMACKCCALWNAVMVLDRADVFLADQKPRELQRNELVSILLRKLDDHQGIVFLTTNRKYSIDEAIQSRVDIILQFPSLGLEPRCRVWRSTITANGDRDRFDVDVANYLEEIAAVNMSIREIKNIVKRALMSKTGLQTKVTGLDLLRLVETRFWAQDYWAQSVMPQPAMPQQVMPQQIIAQDGIARPAMAQPAMGQPAIQDIAQQALAQPALKKKK